MSTARRVHPVRPRRELRDRGGRAVRRTAPPAPPRGARARPLYVPLRRRDELGRRVPPAEAGEEPSFALLFERGDLARSSISRSGRRSPTRPGSPENIAPLEVRTRSTASPTSNFFRFSFQQLQDGTAVLVLDDPRLPEQSARRPRTELGDGDRDAGRGRGDDRLDGRGGRHDAVSAEGRAALERARRRLDRLDLYPRPVRMRRVRIVRRPGSSGCRTSAASTATRSTRR